MVADDILASLRAAAGARLDPAICDFINAGAGEERTIDDNAAAWRKWWLRPRILTDVSTVSTATDLLGARIDLPILLAPVGRQRDYHPDGEEASFAAARDAGAIFCLATSATTDLHTFAEMPGRRWFQLYVSDDRDHTAAVVRGARDAGFERIVLTIDRPVSAHRPRWERHRGSLPVAGRHGVTTHLGDGSLRSSASPGWSASLSWRDLDWIAGLGLPVALKGVLRGEDAKLALNSPVDCLIVSNHGGRQTDGCVPTAVALAEVADVVGGRLPVLVDGGIRSGGDIFRALALGASAVLIGRPFVWGLAAQGAAGVSDVLSALKDQLHETMMLVGCPTVDAITRAFVRPAA